ncbi:LLM class flavin-dependent oxidoreductase [Subtercola endophyticus]|uniref:LLM class flavin-dependent oxidoreductase n=1 Tax=Subtercola endophyticus TaxID=2895559 RepID=UPI001E5778BC|nr:LLM class flavin-dependent oxidoreductase [Subtercola endophyticus]UFS57968.1 LLM class flavin-dependent oxidoreductase [Subtercola endophyticus]
MTAPDAGALSNPSSERSARRPLILWQAEPDPVATQLKTIVALDAAGVDAVLLPSVSPASPDPILVAGAASRRAPAIGLVPMLSPWIQPPFHTARALGTLDALTSGRAGWFVVAGPSTFVSTDDTPRWNASLVTDAGELDSATRDYLEAVFALWNSWQPGALIADVESGQYVDPARVHVTDYHGDFFDVRGPLNMPRPPQGRPTVIARFMAGSAASTKADVAVVDDEADVVEARGSAPIVLLELSGERAAEPVASSADGYLISGISSAANGSLFGEVLYSVLPGLVSHTPSVPLLRDRFALDAARFAWSAPSPTVDPTSSLLSKGLR